MNDSTSPAAGFTVKLAQWIAAAPRNWPSQAIDQAERAIVDTVACMIAGSRDEAVQRIRHGLKQWGAQGTASRIGDANAIDAPWAALINGSAAHALDYDDVLDPAASHVSAVLVPSLLALAEEIDASGADLVDAYITGVEVEQCLAEALNMVHYSHGWHTTLTFGAPAAAAACARLLRLNAVQVCNALSLATSLGAGFKRQFGTNAKPFHAGLGAKNGIVAARMAAAGLTADSAVFEGARGVLDLMAGAEAAGFDGVLQRLAGPPAIVAPGVWLKRYPCCASTHRAVDGLLELRRQHKLTAADIARVDTLVSEPAVRNLMYMNPVNEMQARFSMSFCIAAACYDGDLRLPTFRRESIARADIAAFLARVTMTSDPEQPADMPSTVKSWATTTVTTNDRRSFTLKVVDCKGYPDNPLTEQELTAKFGDCASGQPDAVIASYADWRTVAAAKNIRPLCGVLRKVVAQA